MKSNSKRTQRDYSLAFKLAVDKSKVELTPEQRIKALEKELADTKMKADFFEAVVNVLETDYGVSVVKKRKRKSSRKK